MKVRSTETEREKLPDEGFGYGSTSTRRREEGRANQTKDDINSSYFPLPLLILNLFLLCSPRAIRAQAVGAFYLLFLFAFLLFWIQLYFI